MVPNWRGDSHTDEVRADGLGWLFALTRGSEFRHD